MVWEARQAGHMTCRSMAMCSVLCCVHHSLSCLKSCGCSAGARVMCFAQSGGGFKGNLHKAAAAPGPTAQAQQSPPAVPAAAVAGGSGDAPRPKPAAAAATPEPNRHEAGIKASALFRPGSPISVQTGSSLPHGTAPGSRRGRSPPRSKAAAPLNPATAVAGGWRVFICDEVT